MDVPYPTNGTQKVQFIVEHFTKNVAHWLDGKAKAMVVTSPVPLPFATRRRLTAISSNTASTAYSFTGGLLRQDDR